MTALLAEMEMSGLQRVIIDSILAHCICCVDKAFSRDVQEPKRKYGSIFRREDQAGDNKRLRNHQV